MLSYQTDVTKTVCLLLKEQFFIALNVISKVVPARYQQQQQPMARHMMPTMQPNVGIQPQEMTGENAATISQMTVPDAIQPRQNYLQRNSGTGRQALSSQIITKHIPLCTDFIAAVFLNCGVIAFLDRYLQGCNGCDSQWLKIKLLPTIWRRLKLLYMSNVKLTATCANCVFLIIIKWALSWPMCFLSKSSKDLERHLIIGIYFYVPLLIIFYFNLFLRKAGVTQ